MLVGENELILWLRSALQQILPQGWLVDVRFETDGWDAELGIREPNGATGLVLVEAKTQLNPGAVRSIARRADEQRLHAGCPGAMVVSDYISPRTREMCRDLGLGYADRTGAWRLSIGRPTVIIDRGGASKNPFPDSRGVSSLKGPSAARLIRSIVDWKEPWDAQTLASRARVSASTVSKVTKLLEGESLIGRAPRGPIEWVDWQGVIRRWSLDYSVEGRNAASYFLDPRGSGAALKRMESIESPYAITSGCAANRAFSILANPRLIVYSADPSALTSELGLRQARRGEANVVVLLPYDDRILIDALREGLAYAPWSQVAVDLLAGRDREPSAGDALLEWMATYESKWRERSDQGEVGPPRLD